MMDYIEMINEEKEIFKSIKIPFVYVDCMNVPVPESWKNIKVAQLIDKGKNE